MTSVSTTSSIIHYIRVIISIISFFVSTFLANLFIISIILVVVVHFVFTGALAHISAGESVFMTRTLVLKIARFFALTRHHLDDSIWSRLLICPINDKFIIDNLPTMSVWFRKHNHGIQASSPDICLIIGSKNVLLGDSRD